MGVTLKSRTVTMAVGLAAGFTTTVLGLQVIAGASPSGAQLPARAVPHATLSDTLLALVPPAATPSEAPTDAEVVPVAAPPEETPALPEESPVVPVDIVRGSTGPEVERLQQGLKNLGYDEIGRPDGVAGAQTVRTIGTFQSDVGLEPTGIGDPVTVTEVDARQEQGWQRPESSRPAAPVPAPVATARPSTTPPPAVAPPAPPPSTAIQSPSLYPGIEEAVLARANAARAANGLGPLALDSRLSAVARNWSTTLTISGRLTHNPDYSSQVPAGWSSVGENVAWLSAGWAEGTVAASAHDGWMASPGHRENLLNPAFGSLGVGVAYSSATGWYLTQVFAQY